MSNIIEIKNLKKSYKDVKAVKGIDFYVEEGKLFALLGPNGAGKSTTIDMICTALKPDSGSIIVDGKLVGKDDNAIRKEIGIVFQDNFLDPILTVGENISIRGSFYGLKGNELKNAVKKVCETVGITDLMKRPYGNFQVVKEEELTLQGHWLTLLKFYFLMNQQQVLTHNQGRMFGR